MCLDKEDDPESEHVIGELENIDDECDQHGVSFVKIDNEDEAKEYGIEDFPTLIYFENSIPSMYKGTYIIFHLRSSIYCG